MDCNLTNKQRKDDSAKCRSFDCKPCRNFSELSESLRADSEFLKIDDDPIIDDNISGWNSYNAKPCTISSIKFLRDNAKEILESINSKAEALVCYRDFNNDSLLIKTLEGVMTASKGDYIIQGLNGEFYPCKSEIFHKKYSLNI